MVSLGFELRGGSFAFLFPSLLLVGKLAVDMGLYDHFLFICQI